MHIKLGQKLIDKLRKKQKKENKEEIFINKNIIDYYAKIDTNTLNSINNKTFFNILLKEFAPVESKVNSMYYGDARVLKKYIGLSDFYDLNVNIQHGISFGNVWDQDVNNTKLGFVWGKKLKSIFEKKYNIKAVAIGAPFYYADSFYSKDYIEKEKKRLGKNLLVFPMHSTHFIDCNATKNMLIENLKAYKKDFDSIRICIYWRDIERGLDKAFQENGYECVCVGHIFDFNFLEKQKALFEICDATLSNRIGSYLGYSLFMSKPHLLIPEQFEIVDHLENAGKDEITYWNNNEDYQKIIEIFSNNKNFKITKEQLDTIEPYWGLKEVKTKEYLREIINYDVLE